MQNIVNINNVKYSFVENGEKAKKTWIHVPRVSLKYYLPIHSTFENLINIIKCLKNLFFYRLKNIFHIDIPGLKK